MREVFLTSRHNPHLKNAIALRERKKQRQAQESFLVEGVLECQRALQALEGERVQLRELFFCPDYLDPLGRQVLESVHGANLPGVRLFSCTPACFDLLVVRKGSQGLVGVFTASQPRPLLADFVPAPSSRPLLLLAVEGGENPGNLGAMIRSADGAGADAVILVESPLEAFHPQVIRSSVGTVFSLAVLSASREELRRFCQAHSVQLLPARAQAESASYLEFSYGRQATCFLLGNEHSGLSPAWADLPGVHIPMQGQADSLNLSVAAAVLLYEARRQVLSPRH